MAAMVTDLKDIVKPSCVEKLILKKACH